MRRWRIRAIDRDRAGPGIDRERFDWVVWANAVVRDVARLAAPRHRDAFVVDAAPKAATDPVAADAFFEFCREHALADVAAAEPLDTFADAMWTAYRKPVGRTIEGDGSVGVGDGDGSVGVGDENGNGNADGDGNARGNAETSSLVERARASSGPGTNAREGENAAYVASTASAPHTRRASARCAQSTPCTPTPPLSAAQPRANCPRLCAPMHESSHTQ